MMNIIQDRKNGFKNLKGIYYYSNGNIKGKSSWINNGEFFETYKHLIFLVNSFKNLFKLI